MVRVDCLRVFFRALKNGGAQTKGVMDPFLKGRVDSKYGPESFYEWMNSCTTVEETMVENRRLVGICVGEANHSRDSWVVQEFVHSQYDPQELNDHYSHLHFRLSNISLVGFEGNLSLLNRFVVFSDLFHGEDHVWISHMGPLQAVDARSLTVLDSFAERIQAKSSQAAS